MDTISGALSVDLIIETSSTRPYRGALCYRPSALLLDAGTSDRDLLTEWQIMAALSRIQSSRIIVGREPSMLDAVDRVFSLENGRLREMARPRPLPSRFRSLT